MPKLSVSNLGVGPLDVPAPISRVLKHCETIQVTVSPAQMRQIETSEPIARLKAAVLLSIHDLDTVAPMVVAPEPEAVAPKSGLVTPVPEPETPAPEPELPAVEVAPEAPAPAPEAPAETPAPEAEAQDSPKGGKKGRKAD
jgi:hypothetical protein